MDRLLECLLRARPVAGLQHPPRHVVKYQRMVRRFRLRLLDESFRIQRTPVCLSLHCRLNQLPDPSVGAHPCPRRASDAASELSTLPHGFPAADAPRAEFPHQATKQTGRRLPSIVTQHASEEARSTALRVV